MTSWHHNPERRSWRGRSYKKGGKNIRHLREEQKMTYTELLEDWYQKGRASGEIVDIKFFPLMPEERAALFAKYGTKEAVLEHLAQGVVNMLTAPAHLLTKEELENL